MRAARIPRGLVFRASSRAHIAWWSAFTRISPNHTIGTSDHTAPRVGDSGACDSIPRKSGWGDCTIAFFQGTTNQETSGGGVMSRRVWIMAGTALALMSAGASGQPAPTAQSVLQAVAQNLGTNGLRCVTYTADNGYVGIVGQARDIRDDWPRVQIANYSRTINFETRTSLEDRTIQQGNFPRVGGGGIPINGQQRQIAALVDRT